MLKGLTASASPFFCGCTLWLHSPYAFSLMASKMFLSNRILPATHILCSSGSGKFAAFLSFPHCSLEKLTSEETQANKQKSHKHKGFAACWKCIGVEKQLHSCQLNLIQTIWSKMITRLCFVQKDLCLYIGCTTRGNHEQHWSRWPGMRNVMARREEQQPAEEIQFLQGF